MINFRELHDLALRLAKEPPFTADNLYVDLLLTITLGEIQSEFDFILKGGTAIVKVWMQPYRFSYDLDFSYFAPGDPRKHYKKYQLSLKEKLTSLGFNINEKGEETHRSGGRIFILHLMDGGKYLKRPVKLSISSIDPAPCFPPVKQKFKTIVPISKPEFKLLYPDLVPKMIKTEANVLTIEELCAEKIRALATRGTEEGWSLLLRDVFDLYMMDSQGILDKALSSESGQKCIKHKFSAIKGTNYWKKFQDFQKADPKVKIREEDQAIFFNPRLLTEKKAEDIIRKIQTALIAL